MATRKQASNSKINDNNMNDLVYIALATEKLLCLTSVAIRIKKTKELKLPYKNV